MKYYAVIDTNVIVSSILKRDSKILVDNYKNEATDVLVATNKYRSNIGVNKLVLDDKLSEVATIRAMEIALNNKFSHERPDGTYYSKLFDEKDYKAILKKYNNNKKIKSNKEFIIKTIEKVCKEVNMERFKVYNMPYLITRLKYRMAGKNKSHYYDFIKNIKDDKKTV